MPNNLNLIGNIYDHLIVIKRHPENTHGGRSQWVCKCSCGNEIVKAAHRLVKKQKSNNCGCINLWRDLLGQTFGSLTVVCEDVKVFNKSSSRAWKCICSCGNYTIVRPTDLIGGHFKSCGCSRPNKHVDLTNTVFGNLIVISKQNALTTKSKKWLCKCSCGVDVILTSTDLLRTKKPRTNCGCLNTRKIYPSLLNKIYGKLKVIYETKSNRNRRAWACLCECGKTTIQETSFLVSGIVLNCPDCFRYKTEKLCMSLAQDLTGLHFNKHRVYYNKENSKQFMEFDGYNEEIKLAIEYQGIQHYEYNSWFHKTKKEFQNQLYRDILKRNYCIVNGIKLIEVPYTEAKDLQIYLKTVFTYLNIQLV